MNNIIVNESPLKVVVGEKKETGCKSRNHKEYHCYGENDCPECDQEYGYNQAINKTLSTPLPPVEDCVEVDVVGLDEFVNNLKVPKESKKIFMEVAKAIANSKSILKWRSV